MEKEERTVMNEETALPEKQRAFGKAAGFIRKFFYVLFQCTWGFPQTLVGLIVFLANIRRKHFFYHGSVVTVWDSGSSVSLGLFLFVTRNAFGIVSRRGAARRVDLSRELLVHEYGHTIQSLVLGPLYLPVIGLPSVLWATRPKNIALRRAGMPYSAYWTENSANRLGERATKEASLRGTKY